jgi:hypothetical protein
MNSLYCRPSASRRPIRACRRKSDRQYRSSSPMCSSLASRVQPTRRPPLFAAGAACVGGAFSVANVVVITGASRLRGPRRPFQQLRVETAVFDICVYVELVGERTPYPLERGAVDGCLRPQIVQPGELFPKPFMIGEDQPGDASHTGSQPPDRCVCGQLSHSASKARVGFWGRERRRFTLTFNV